MNEFLREQLVEILNETPQRIEIVGLTGEPFTEEALEVARIFDRVCNGYKDAILRAARSFDVMQEQGRFLF